MSDLMRGDPIPERTRISYVLSYAILFGGLLTIIVALYMVVTTYSSLPFWDGWGEVGLAANGGSPLSHHWLWQQHNEHRLVIPKLFLAADLRLFKARQVFLLASIFAIQLMHLALLTWSMRVLGGWRGALWRTGTGLAAFCLFCPSQWENLTWSFQVSFVLAQFLATLSFVALLLYWTGSQRQPDKQPSSKFLVVSVVGALGATYSLATGILLWPLLVAAALYLRLRVRAVLSFAITGVVSTALYLRHFVSPYADPIAWLGRPLKLLDFCAVYFSSSWLRSNSWLWLVLAGRAGYKRQLIAFAVLGVLPILAALLHPMLSFARIFRPFAIQLVLTVFFCVSTALITSTGRSMFGMSRAAAPRYQTVALLFWCCLGLLWIGSAFFGRPRKRHSFLLAEVCLLAIFARGAALAKYPISEAQAHGFSQKAVAASLLTGVNDSEIFREAYPSEFYPNLSILPNIFRRIVPYMKANRLSVFSDTTGSALGKPLESVLRLGRGDQCVGALESVKAIDDASGPGLRVVGWVWQGERRQPASSVIATTNGLVTGLGAVGAWRPYVQGPNPGLPSRYDGFIAFVPEPQPGSVVELYAILGGTPPVACYIDRIVK